MASVLRAWESLRGLKEIGFALRRDWVPGSWEFGRLRVDRAARRGWGSGGRGEIAHAFFVLGFAGETFFFPDSFVGDALLIVDFFAGFGLMLLGDLSSGLVALALASPVFFSGAMNLPRGSFFLSGAAAMVRGWGPA